MCYGQQDDPAQPDDPQPVDPQPAADDPKEPDNAENTEPEKKMKEGVYTILLAGTFDDYNTDTLILCRVDTNTDQVNMVSINRDSQVETKINNKRINCIYGYAGIEDMCQAVTDITGVPVNYYVVINGKSFVDMIDLIGGVEYTVPYHMYHGDKDPNSHIDLPAGTYTLTGWQAQQYVRFRSTKHLIEHIQIEPDHVLHIHVGLHILIENAVYEPRTGRGLLRFAVGRYLGGSLMLTVVSRSGKVPGLPA